MANQLINDLTQAPLPDMLENLGTAIANSQFAMDSNSMQIARMMGDRDKYGVQFSGEDEKRSLLELGLAPRFIILVKLPSTSASRYQCRNLAKWARPSVQQQVVVLALSCLQRV